MTKIAGEARGLMMAGYLQIRQAIILIFGMDNGRC